MAAPVVTTVLQEDDLGVTLIATGTFTDTQEAALLKLDASALRNITPSATPKCSIARVTHNCQGSGTITVKWDANTDVNALVLSGVDDVSYVGHEVANNGGAGVTGDVLFTTAGFASGEGYSVTIRFIKASGFTYRPVVAVTAAVDELSGIYETGDEIALQLDFSQIAFIDSGSSGIDIALESGDVKATYAGPLTVGETVTGSGTPYAVFKYTVKDTDQAEATELTLEHITGVRGCLIGAKEVIDAFSTLDVTGYTVNAAAVVSTVALNDDFSEVYVTDDVLGVKVTMSRTVTVTGTPLLPLTIDSGNKNASFIGYGVDQTELLFEYTIVEADVAEATEFDIAGDIDVNGGTITNLNSASAAVLTLAASTTSSATINAA